VDTPLSSQGKLGAGVFNKLPPVNLTPTLEILPHRANSGLGFITSCVFACLGANVHIGVRTKAKGDETIQQIIDYVKEHEPERASGVQNRLFAHYAEMSDFASVRAFCQSFQQPIDILVNNAGLQSNEKKTTKDGYEMTWQVNYLSSTFLTTKLLLPLLVQAGKDRGKRAKVINITSGMHKMVKDLDLDDINFDKKEYDYTEGETI
jgi:NAD(P)-dependent dehydrogenase (short-subunit alcohol dehydrogenase family)